MPAHHLFDLESVGWERLSARSWRRPDGRVHEFPVGDEQAVVLLAPQLLELMSHLKQETTHMRTEIQALVAKIQPVLDAAARIDTAATVIEAAVANLQATIATLKGGAVLDPDDLAALTDAGNKLATVSTDLSTQADKLTAASAPTPPVGAPAQDVPPRPAPPGTVPDPIVVAPPPAPPVPPDSPPPSPGTVTSLWAPVTSYATNARVTIASGAVLVAAFPGGTSGSVQPTGPGLDGTVTWAAA
jgi:hypothetical protein